jgi:signal transduction histidine kinase
MQSARRPTRRLPSVERPTPHLIRELIESAAAVAGQVELSALLRATVDTAMELTGAEYGALGVLGEHGTLVDFIHRGMDQAVVAAIGEFPRGRGVLGIIGFAGKTVRIDDISTHPDAAGFPEHHPPMGPFLGVPVRVGDEIFGNLYLTEKEGGFTEEDEMVVELLAVTAGAAVSTLRLQERLRRAALHEDRERIARDLHDSIIQDLFAVGLGLQASLAKLDSDPDVVRSRMDEAVDQLDGAISSLRRFIFDLRPPVWARPDLEAEVRRLVADLARPHDTSVGVSVQCEPGVPASDVSGHLVAVIREALSNALRHANASRIDINLWSEPTRVVATITDDGTGFDTGLESGGLGLENIGRRVAEAGGAHTIDSAPGRGTTVRVEVPRE